MEVTKNPQAQTNAGCVSGIWKEQPDRSTSSRLRITSRPKIKIRIIQTRLRSTSSSSHINFYSCFFPNDPFGLWWCKTGLPLPATNLYSGIEQTKHRPYRAMTCWHLQLSCGSNHKNCRGLFSIRWWCSGHQLCTTPHFQPASETWPHLPSSSQPPLKPGETREPKLKSPA